MPTADDSFRIDGYKFLPRSMIPEFKAFPYQADDVTKTSAGVPIKNARVALLTSAGLYLKDEQPSFDLDRERREPLWGDPTYRVIPRHVRQTEIAMAHLHLNPQDTLADINIALPLRCLRNLRMKQRLALWRRITIPSWDIREVHRRLGAMSMGPISRSGSEKTTLTY